MAPLNAELNTLTAQFLDILPFAVIVESGLLPVHWTWEFQPPLELMDAHRADLILSSVIWTSM